MDRIVELGDVKIGLRANALTPRLYRFKIGRDMIVDLNNLKKSYQKVMKSRQASTTDEEFQDQQLSIVDLTVFENAAYIMSKQYDNSLPGSPEEWLDSMDSVFTIYELLPHILELWQLNQQTTSIPKKA